MQGENKWQAESRSFVQTARRRDHMTWQEEYPMEASLHNVAIAIRHLVCCLVAGNSRGQGNDASRVGIQMVSEG